MILTSCELFDRMGRAASRGALGLPLHSGDFKDMDTKTNTDTQTKTQKFPDK